jgi:Spy/CpxP family protein refolding chaperone
MKSIRFRLIIAALCVLMGTAIAKSQTAADAPAPPSMHGHGYGMGGDRMEFFATSLNLTDDQKGQMKTILQKEHPAMKPLFQQSRQIEQQLHQYVEGPYDETKVRALANQKAQVEVELTVARTRVHNELFQVLNPDQQSKLKELEATHESRLQKHMQRNDAPDAAPQQ